MTGLSYIVSLYTLASHSVLLSGQNVFASYRAHKQKIWYVTIVNNKDNIMYGDGRMATP